MSIDLEERKSWRPEQIAATIAVLIPITASFSKEIQRLDFIYLINQILESPPGLDLQEELAPLVLESYPDPASALYIIDEVSNIVDLVFYEIDKELNSVLDDYPFYRLVRLIDKQTALLVREDLCHEWPSIHTH